MIIAKKIKLCGFTKADSLSYAIDCGVDFVGFVFVANSPRQINIATAQQLAKVVGNKASKVAVVNDLRQLNFICEAIQPDYWQLHGDISVNQLLAIKQQFPAIGIIKAFNISNVNDLACINDYALYSDYFLLDAKISGEGRAFSWQMLQNFHSSKPIILAGGINQNNILQAFNYANIVDISSGIEKIRGEKSIDLIKNCINLCRNQH